MPVIETFKRRNPLARNGGIREYSEHFVVIPVELVRTLGWKKGDELKFMFKDGEVVLRKGEGQNQAVFVKKVKPLSTSAYVSVPRRFVGKEALVVVREEAY